MFNVARYLPDYFASLEAQTHGLTDVQIILVDDGSTDETRSLAEEFASRRSNVEVIHQPNAGQAAARNTGLGHAIGAWVSFPDPDDALDSEYLASIDAAIALDGDEVALVAARVLQWDERSGERVDNHALAFRARGGDITVDLRNHPDYVQPHVHSAFFRRDLLVEKKLRFQEKLRVRFEDGGFVAKYMLSCVDPMIRYATTAHYFYRHRADGSSTVQASTHDPRKYVDTIRYGYLDVIESARAMGHTRLPRWLQNTMLYDQFWVLRSSFYGAARNVSFAPEIHVELEALLQEFLTHIDDDAIQHFRLMHVSQWMKDVFLLVKRGHGSSPLRRGATDSQRGLTAFEFSYRGDPPPESVWIAGRRTQPHYVKNFALEYVGRPVAWKRTLWVPSDAAVAFEIDGEYRHFDGPKPPKAGQGARLRTRPRLGRALLPRRSVSAPDLAWLRSRARVVGTRRVARKFIPFATAWVASRSRLLGRRYTDAWVFMDRDVDANDSAEILFKWVAVNRPDINSWFVVRKGTPDWKRLRREGARVVGYGTPRFYALLMNAQHFASSHADRFVTGAMPRGLGRTRYRFTFLQHGVIKSDISKWLNTKRIDLFLTSTEDEYGYITGPSPFRFGARETRLLGLPRFDDLLKQADSLSSDARRVVLVAPTWRDYLVGPMDAASNRRAKVEDFRDSTYAQALGELLRHPLLKEVAEARQLDIVFLPHPNMRAYLDDFDVPTHVRLQSYDDEDVRHLIARTEVMVTDYSSIAFNLAYLQRPTVYFQFDREEFSNLHTERPGYFAYETHGFGPVTSAVDEAVESVRQVLEGNLDDRYHDRMLKTFPVRDGRNCERVIDAMDGLTHRKPLAERSIAAVTDSWELLTASESPGAAVS